MVIAVRSWGDLRRLPIWGVLTWVVLSAAACSDAATSTSSSSPAVSSAAVAPVPSATASSAASSPAPILPDAAKQPTRPGAEAFVRHFFAAYTYSFSVMDSQELRAISDHDCRFCVSAIDSVESGRAKGEKTVGGHIMVTVAVAGPGDASDRLIVNALLDQDSGQTVSAEHQILVRVPERKGFRLDAAVRWETHRWIFLNAHIVQPGES
jgi:hypothetical protein